jgi:CYTH domain-containing protein
MPTENERKYVLRLECEEQVKEAAENFITCRQAYLVFSKGMTARVRESIDQIGYSKYKFCFKQKVNGRVIEVETKIDQRDFDDLWSVSMNRLEKIRYNVYSGELDLLPGFPFKFPAGLWEVDFFKNGDETYFVLAEHEMPEGQLEPKSMPDIIQKNLLYAPEIDDGDYSSKNLADMKHATRKYQELLKK